MEKARLQNLQAGHRQSSTLSSWIRHQIAPFLDDDCNAQPCQISNDLYQKIEELARLLNKTPEATIAECVNGIENLIRRTDAKRPLIVAEWRLREQYRTSRKATK